MKRINNNTVPGENALTPSIPQRLKDEIGFAVIEKQGKAAFVCVVNNEKTGGNGYLLGIAEQGTTGYTPTMYILDEPNYHIASKWVDDLNEACGLTKLEAARIMLSTMAPMQPAD